MLMNRLLSLGIRLSILAACNGLLQAQSWQPVASTGPASAGVPLLLTDGTVMVQNSDTSAWWKLTPDAFGDYTKGTWNQLASLPTGYGPLYFASAVLADGRVFVMGGEYSFGSAVWSSRGALYDPIADTWTEIAPPTGWLQIGDAQCTVLPDGRLMMADPFNTNAAILDPSTLTWTPAGTGKVDRFDEEGWTLLPDGTILTLDALSAPHAERYIPSLDQWVSAGDSPVRLEDPASQELGPMVLRPDGTVFATGATGHTAIYTPGATLLDPGTWVAGPDFPILPGIGQLDIADGPACLLPSGNVLCGASPGVFRAGTLFFEFDGTTLIPVPATPRSPQNSSYVGNFLMLPTGQALYTDFSADVQIYTPSTGVGNDSWRPTLTNCPSLLNPGDTVVLQGTQFNGLSQGNAYGDDSSNAENYPLVRIHNLTTDHVVYCRTSNHSTMGVATGSTPTTTQVAIPGTVEPGPSTLEVIANGIASFPVPIAITTGSTDFPLIFSLAPSTVEAALPGFTLTIQGTGFHDTDLVSWVVGTNSAPLPTVSISSNLLTVPIPANLVANSGSALVRVSRADGILSHSATFTIATDIPSVSAISPTTIQAFSPGFEMGVSGVRFRAGDTVLWNNGLTTTPLATTFLTSNQLSATVPAGLIANAGSSTVLVQRTSAKVSNSTAFTITPDFPILFTLTPQTVAAASPDQTLTLTGQRFNSGDVVMWSYSSASTALASTYVSDSTLTAVVPAALLANGGLASVWIVDRRGQTSFSLNFNITPPQPVLDSIGPATVSAGTPTFTITCTGSLFANTSQIVWQTAGGTKTPLTTTYVSPTTLTAVVPAAFVAAQGRANVFVTTPGPGASLASLQFLITPPLTLTAVSPNSAVAGTTFTLSAKGANFLNGAGVLINGTVVPATITSATQLSASIPGSLIPFGGATTLSIVNPGGAISAAASFTIQNPGPRVTSVSPTSISLGGPTFTVTVTGTGFQPTSVIRWSGTAISTTYVSPTQLQATVVGSLFPKKGNYAVSVQSPTPGGGGSNSVNISAN